MTPGLRLMHPRRSQWTPKKGNADAVSNELVLFSFLKIKRTAGQQLLICCMCQVLYMCHQYVSVCNKKLDWYTVFCRMTLLNKVMPILFMINFFLYSCNYKGEVTLNITLATISLCMRQNWQQAKVGRGV